MDELMIVSGTDHDQPGTDLSSTPGVLVGYVVGIPDTSGALIGDCADIRDTADIHLLALEHPDAAGVRVLVRSGEYLVPTMCGFRGSCTFHPIQRHLHGKICTTYSTVPNFQI
jgi:hypothetical protein